MKLKESELDTLADAIATDVETSAANPIEGVGDFSTCATVTAVESLMASRITERMAVAECRIAEVKAICFAADDPDSERYTSDQAGIVHLIADIREAIGV